MNPVDAFFASGEAIWYASAICLSPSSMLLSEEASIQNTSENLG
jgi:hypothetical protein